MHHIELDTLTLASGGHDEREDGVCLLEAVAWWAGEDHSDMPACVSKTLQAFGTRLNDVLPHDKRQTLKQFIPVLVGTRGDGRDETRGYMALDWLVRTYLPTWLRLVPALTAQADLLAQHAPITDLETAASIGDMVKEAASQAAAAGDAAWAAARDAAWAAAEAAARAAAGDAARAAAWAAAGDAAWAAARDAAWAAAWAAAGDAARAAARAAAEAAAGDAARAAAGDAARAAARDALTPTVETLQDSAIELYGAMIRGAK